MLTQLFDLELNEISLVKTGDDPEAKIIMTKMQKAPMKTEGGKEYPAEAFAYAPDSESPSTWKLRLWENPQDKVTATQVGRAVAALGSGFRGNKVQIPNKDLESVKRKVATAYKEANPEKEVPKILTKENSEMKYNREQLQEMDVEALVNYIMSMQNEKEEGEMEKKFKKSLDEKDVEIKKAKDELVTISKELEDLKEEQIKKEKESVKKELAAKAEKFIVPGVEKEQIVKNLVSAHEAGTLHSLEAAYEATTKALKDSDLLKEKGGSGGDGEDVKKSKIQSMIKSKMDEGMTEVKAKATLYKTSSEYRELIKEK